MATITTADVNKLRTITGAGMMDCKNALVSAKGDFNLAVKNLQIGDADYLFESGKSKYELEDYEGAITDFTKAIEIEPNEEILYFMRGEAKVNLMDNQGAILDYTRAIEIDPKYELAYRFRGDARGDLKDFQGAIADLTKAIQINPNKTHYNNRGNIKGEFGDFQGAIADLTKAIEIAPNYAMGYNNRGFIKSKIKDYNGAISDFSRAIQLEPDSENAYRNRAFEKVMQQDYHGAITDCTKAIELNSNDALAYCNRSIAKIGLKDHQGAMQDYAKAREVDSVYAEYYKNGGIVNDGLKNERASQYYWFFNACSQFEKLDLKSVNDANQVIRVCDEFNRNVNRFYVYIHEILCDAFILKKEYGRATDELRDITEELVADNLHVWKYYAKIGNLHIASSNTKDAIENYKKAYHYCTDNVEKIVLNEKLQKLIDNYNNLFIKLPYSQRKWVVVDDNKTVTSDAIVVLDKNNLPQTIHFPVGHPLKEELYIVHPFVNSSYMPYSEYDNSLFIDRYNEFKLFIQCLGAKSMRIEVIKGSEKSSSIINNQSSDKNDTISGNASAGFKVFGGNVSGSSNNSSASINNSNRGVQEDLQTSRATIQHFDPKKKPYLSSKLIWYNNEPTWQRLFEQRMAGSILHHSETWSSKSNYSISEKEEKSLKEAFKEFVSADVGIGMFKANGRIDIDGHSNKEELVDKTFNQSESIEWRIEIEFEPIENLLEDYTETEPINTIAVCTSTSNKDEEEYLEEVKFHLEDDGEIDEKERSALERFREKRGISKERAIELENQLLSVGDLNEAEKEYLEEYQEILNEGEITEKERRILDRMANRAGISEDRIKELEKFV